MRILVPPHQDKIRIDLYLTHQVANATRSRVQAAIRDGLVLVNGRIVKASFPITGGEVIDVELPRPPKMEAKPEEIPLVILFEDDQLIIVNKPPGMVTHPAYSNYTGTLVNALLHHTQRLSGVNSEIRPGIVHRLDKDTSGLMVVAKNDMAHQRLAKQFSKRTITREYWALVWGAMKEPAGVIEASLGRSKRDRKKITVTTDGKPAITEYEVLQQFEYLSLVRLRLKTGRTHQIRVHLAHVGHPVFGDPTYGGRSSAWGGLEGKRAQQAQNLLALLPRQALHAKTIGFLHPISREQVYFESELPEDFSTVLARLK